MCLGSHGSLQQPDCSLPVVPAGLLQRRAPPPGARTELHHTPSNRLLTHRYTHTGTHTWDTSLNSGSCGGVTPEEAWILHSSNCRSTTHLRTLFYCHVKSSVHVLNMWRAFNVLLVVCLFFKLHFYFILSYSLLILCCTCCYCCRNKFHSLTRLWTVNTTLQLLPEGEIWPAASERLNFLK